MIRMDPVKLYIICSSDEPNNVVFGHAEFARSAGFEPVFVFPSRTNARDFSGYYSNYQTVRLGFVFRVSSPASYWFSTILLMLWMSYVFLFRWQAKHFLAIDLPGTLACLVLKIRRCFIHTLVNDNFSARYNLSPIVFVALRLFEATVFRFVCSSCIFPDKSRYELLGSPDVRRVYYVPNILCDAYAPTFVGSTSDKLVVMLCGWLVASRGLELLEGILNRTSDKIEFLLVGSGDESMINVLRKWKRIKYLGHVDRKTNLDLMAKVDINFALYSPCILINRFALPQKIYDSLIVGCPLFVNSEVNMSTALRKAGACISANYFDVESISKTLNELAEDKSSLTKMSKNALIYCSQHANYKQAQLDGKGIYIDIIVRHSS